MHRPRRAAASFGAVRTHAGTLAARSRGGDMMILITAACASVMCSSMAGWHPTSSQGQEVDGKRQACGEGQTRVSAV